MKTITVKSHGRLPQVGDLVTFYLNGRQVYDYITHVGKHTVEGKHYDLSYENFDIVTPSKTTSK